MDLIAGSAIRPDMQEQETAMKRDCPGALNRERFAGKGLDGTKLLKFAASLAVPLPLQIAVDAGKEGAVKTRELHDNVSRRKNAAWARIADPDDEYHEGHIAGW